MMPRLTVYPDVDKGIRWSSSLMVSIASSPGATFESEVRGRNIDGHPADHLRLMWGLFKDLGHTLAWDLFKTK